MTARLHELCPEFREQLGRARTMIRGKADARVRIADFWRDERDTARFVFDWTARMRMDPETVLCNRTQTERARQLERSRMHVFGRWQQREEIILRKVQPF